MNTTSVISQFRQKVSAKIDIQSEGRNSFVVFTPFQFDDGDHLRIVLRNEKGEWYLTDEGHTFMHVSYEEIDLSRGKRAEIIDGVLVCCGIQRENGELRAYVEDGAYGDALYSFVQALIKITDITYTSVSRVKSLFLEEFHAFLEESIPEESRVFDYHDPQHDPEGKYLVDCRANGTTTPLHVFGIHNDDKCRDATITCLQFERFGVWFDSMAVFENQESINRKVLARFSDVVGKLYSSLPTNKDRICEYLSEFRSRS